MFKFLKDVFDEYCKGLAEAKDKDLGLLAFMLLIGALSLLGFTGVLILLITIIVSTKGVALFFFGLLYLAVKIMMVYGKYLLLTDDDD